MDGTDVLNVELFAADSLSSGAVKESLVERFWGKQTFKANQTRNFDAFFTYYQAQCDAEDPDNHVVRTHKDIVKIIEAIRSSPSSQLVTIRANILANNPDWDDAQRLPKSIELAVRLWLMINVRIVLPADRHQSRMVSWPDSSSLVSVTRQYFKRASRGSQPIKQFSHDMHAYTLERIGGFKTRWTDHLSSHLYLEGDTIYLFQHVSIIKCMRDDSAISALLPINFLDETLDSISLVLPRTIPKCDSWLRSRVKNQGLDPGLRDLDIAPRKVFSYDYWREDLVTIAEAYDRHEPSNLFQWIHDRRKRVQWWTFWIAAVAFALTIAFGLIQTVTGIVQAWASVQGLNGHSKAIAQ